MNATQRQRAEALRARLEQGPLDPLAFREALLAEAPEVRDDWIDVVLGLEDIPDDGPALPRQGVPYLPCSVDTLLRTIDLARIGPSDVFVDVGSGVGRAASLVNLLTGAEAIGIEVQPTLYARARAVAARLRLYRVFYVEGDAATLIDTLSTGTVFFLYCPFGGERLTAVLSGLEALARARPLRLACVDLPIPPSPWLKGETIDSGDLVVRWSAKRSDEPRALASAARVLPLVFALGAAAAGTTLGLGACGSSSGSPTGSAEAGDDVAALVTGDDAGEAGATGRDASDDAPGLQAAEGGSAADSGPDSPGGSSSSGGDSGSVANDAGSDAGTMMSVYVTFYGWADNSPPGGAIAYPMNGGFPTLHDTAGGTGTYADPITFATDKSEFPVGTRLYVPFIEKYVMMEDDCVECDSDWTTSHKWHVDLWMNSNGTES
ncbi:MAG: hypothetical protein ACRENE_02285, partial [Polyangiaceae bacterium]